VILPDRHRVPVKPPATLRCGMATAVVQWIRSDVAALAADLGTTVSELDNFDSFECRGRNRIVGAKLSEHGRANALDVRGIKLANGRSLSLTDRDVPRDIRKKVMASVCERFTTVLGPGSDGYHEDHIHLDLAERRNGYRICQWELDGAAPLVATTPLPPPRPETAPPRELASGEVTSQGEVDAPRTVEQLTLRPATPPPVSLSPVPMAKQPTDVAKPARTRPDAATAAAPRDSKRTVGNKPVQIAPEVTPAARHPSARRLAGRKPARAKRHQPQLPDILRRVFE